MAIATGAPLGTIVSQEEIYINTAPYMYFQNALANPLNNPDADNYYWGLSGTATYSVYQLGCIVDVSLRESLTMNDVRCDTQGQKATVQRRDYVEFVMTVQSILPLSEMRNVLKLSAPTVTTGFEKVGIGSVNNNIYWHIYAPVVYDTDTGDLLMFHLHRAQFVDAWEIAMKNGENWSFQVMARAYADDTKPEAQKFGVIIRHDPSALP